MNKFSKSFRKPAKKRKTIIDEEKSGNQLEKKTQINGEEKRLMNKCFRKQAGKEEN